MSRVLTVVVGVYYKVTNHLASKFLSPLYILANFYFFMNILHVLWCFWMLFSCLFTVLILLIVCTEETIIRSNLCIWSAAWIHFILLFSSLRIYGWSWSMSERNGESERSHYFCSSLSCPWSHSSRLIPALVTPFLRSLGTGKNGKYAKLPKRTGTFL